MKNITRRRFLMRPGFLCIAFTGETKEDKLREEISDLMEEANMSVRYEQDNHPSPVQLIDSKQIIKAKIPMKKLYEVRRRLVEHVSDYKPLREEEGVLYVYEDIDIT